MVRFTTAPALAGGGGAAATPTFNSSIPVGRRSGNHPPTYSRSYEPTAALSWDSTYQYHTRLRRGYCDCGPGRKIPATASPRRPPLFRRSTRQFVNWITLDRRANGNVRRSRFFNPTAAWCCADGNECDTGRYTIAGTASLPAAEDNLRNQYRRRNMLGNPRHQRLTIRARTTSWKRSLHHPDLRVHSHVTGAKLIPV